MREESKLKRTLGFWDLMAIAVGQIIGAGIMSNTGVGIGMTGTGVVLAFILSPVLVLFSIIFPNAILGAVAPTTGGAYRYSSRLMGKTAGMFYLLMFTTTNLMIATLSISFASYFVSIFTGANQQLVSIIILTFFFIINLIGVKSAAILNKIMTVMLIGGLAIFIIFGIGKADLGYVFDPANMFRNGPSQFLATVALLSSATSGAQILTLMGGEAKDPGKNIPRVMIVSTCVVAVFYVFIAIVAAGVLPVEQVADQPLTYVAQATMPQMLVYLFVIGGALGATATTLNSTMSYITKPFLIACDDGLLPKSFASVSKNGVPWKVLTFWFLLGLVPLIGGFSLSFISKFTVANSLIVKLMSNVCLVVLIKKYPQLMKKSPFKLSNKATTAVSIAGALVLVILSYSLFAKLSYKVALFMIVCVVALVIYSKTVIKNVVLPDDLNVDYVGGQEQEAPSESAK